MRRPRLTPLTPMEGIVGLVARNTKATQKATQETVRAFLSAVRAHVTVHGRLKVPGLGTLSVRSRKARRVALPPGAGEGTIDLPEMRTVHLRPDKSWGLR